MIVAFLLDGQESTALNGGPDRAPAMLTDDHAEEAERVMAAMLGMKKIDVEALQQAYAQG